MNLQDQIRLHKEISLKIEELEEQKKALANRLYARYARQVPSNGLLPCQALFTSIHFHDP